MRRASTFAPKGLYKFRMRLGQWYIHLTDLDHNIIESRGPYAWADIETHAKQAKVEGFKREQ